MKKPAHMLSVPAVARIVEAREAREIEAHARELRAQEAAESAERERIAALLEAPWANVVCTRVGPFWRLSGVWRGREHSGTGTDGDELAAKLNAIALREGGASGPPVVAQQPKVNPGAPAPDPGSGELAGDSNAQAETPAIIDADLTAITPLPAEGGRLVPFNPEGWRTLGEAEDALRAEIEYQHRTRTLARQRHLNRVLELAGDDSDGAALEVQQHRQWANALALVDQTRERKLAAVAGVFTLEEARELAWHVAEGWET